MIQVSTKNMEMNDVFDSSRNNPDGALGSVPIPFMGRNRAGLSRIGKHPLTNQILGYIATGA